jgi:hypothetical protein
MSPLGSGLFSVVEVWFSGVIRRDEGRGGGGRSTRVSESGVCLCLFLGLLM